MPCAISTNSPRVTRLTEKLAARALYYDGVLDEQATRRRDELADRVYEEATALREPSSMCRHRAHCTRQSAQSLVEVDRSVR